MLELESETGVFTAPLLGWGAMTKRLSISMISDLFMSEEQKKKFSVKKEYVDYRHVVSRNRIENQTIYDVLFVRDHIEQAQHEAAILFMEELSHSGANPASVNLDAINHVPAYLVGDRMSERRMAFSDSYRSMVAACGKRSANYMMTTAANVYVFPVASVPEKIWPREQEDFAKRVARLISPPLWALAAHFGTDKKSDPRNIIRRQMGHRNHKQKKPRSRCG